MDITINTNLVDNIIAVIDAVCEKFGIAFDWSSENLLPKLQLLIERFSKYRIGMFSSLLFISVFFAVISFILYKKHKDDSYDSEEWLTILLIFASILVLTMAAFCAVHIPRCINLPELELYSWAKFNGYLK